jgi:hypothetical protein
VVRRKNGGRKVDPDCDGHGCARQRPGTGVVGATSFVCQLSAVIALRHSLSNIVCHSLEASVALEKIRPKLSALEVCLHGVPPLAGEDEWRKGWV